MLKITNEKSSFFNKNVKLINTLENEMVEVFLIDEERIIVVPIEDIQKQKNKVFLPKSRKDFYNYMQEAGTTRTDIKNSIAKMIDTGAICLNCIKKEELLNIFDDASKSRLELIEEFRTIRNEQKFDFNLKNRS